jgi:uncharacterized protein (TIGR02611 family)
MLTTSQDHPATPPVQAETAVTAPAAVAPSWFWLHVRRVIVFVIGTTVILIGVALLVLPGPGWVTIFGGLAILATEFAWARWILKRAQHHLQQYPVTASMMATSGKWYEQWKVRWWTKR